MCWATKQRFIVIQYCLYTLFNREVIHLHAKWSAYTIYCSYKSAQTAPTQPFIQNERLLFQLDKSQNSNNFILILITRKQHGVFFPSQLEKMYRLSIAMIANPNQKLLNRQKILQRDKVDIKVNKKINGKWTGE